MKKRIFYFVGIIYALSVFYYFEIRRPREYALFYKSQINNRVLEIGPGYGSNYMKLYKLDNDIRMPVLCKDECILVGDSIFKEEQSSLISIYRNNGVVYTFIRYKDVKEYN